MTDVTDVAEKLFNTLATYLDIGHSNFLQIDSMESIEALLDSKDPNNKIQALRSLINLYQTEEKATSQKLLMQVIKTCADVPDNLLKKHLLLYYEITGLGTDKCDPERKSMFILACNSLMKNLESGNEYIIGATLRFLSKVTDEEFLKQLFPSIVTKVQHNHPYVRRAAVQCFESLFAHHPDMLRQAPEILYQLLLIEKDVLTQRNCLHMLFNCEDGFKLAIDYLSQHRRELTRYHPSIQLLISQMLRVHIQRNPKESQGFVTFLQRLLNSSYPTVRYEAARGLMIASSQPKIIHAVVDCFVKIYSSVPDVNVKLVALDRLIAMKQRYRSLLASSLSLSSLFKADNQGIVMRNKRTRLVLELLTPANASELLPLLHKEATRLLQEAQERDLRSRLRSSKAYLAAVADPTNPTASTTAASQALAEKEEEQQHVVGRVLLISCLRACALLIPNETVELSAALLEFLDDPDVACATSAIGIVRELLDINASAVGSESAVALSEENSQALVTSSSAKRNRTSTVNEQILQNLLDHLRTCGHTRVIHICLWLLGQYCPSPSFAYRIIEGVLDIMSPFPLLPPSQDNSTPDSRAALADSAMEQPGAVSFSSSSSSSSYASISSGSFALASHQPSGGRPAPTPAASTSSSGAYTSLSSSSSRAAPANAGGPSLYNPNVQNPNAVPLGTPSAAPYPSDRASVRTDAPSRVSVSAATNVRVLEDGTYASTGSSETALQQMLRQQMQKNIRDLITRGDMFLASALCAMLTKLAVRVCLAAATAGSGEDSAWNGERKVTSENGAGELTEGGEEGLEGEAEEEVDEEAHLSTKQTPQQLAYNARKSALSVILAVLHYGSHNTPQAVLGNGEVDPFQPGVVAAGMRSATAISSQFNPLLLSDDFERIGVCVYTLLDTLSPASAQKTAEMAQQCLAQAERTWLSDTHTLFASAAAGRTLGTSPFESLITATPTGAASATNAGPHALGVSTKILDGGAALASVKAQEKASKEISTQSIFGESERGVEDESAQKAEAEEDLFASITGHPSLAYQAASADTSALVDSAVSLYSAARPHSVNDKLPFHQLKLVPVGEDQDKKKKKKSRRGRRSGDEGSEESSEGSEDDEDGLLNEQGELNVNGLLGWNFEEEEADGIAMDMDSEEARGYLSVANSGDLSAVSLSSSSGLSKPLQVIQLSGLSDPIFVEAALNVLHYAVIIEFSFVNRTKVPLSNVGLEFVMSAAMSTSDASLNFSLTASMEPIKQTVTFHISPDEMGTVQPYLSFRLPSQADIAARKHPSLMTQSGPEHYIMLSRIDLDTLFSAGPVASPPPVSTVRALWSQFIWETKVPLKTNCTDLTVLVEQIATACNMQLLPYGHPMEHTNDCTYLSALFYARSRFGQDIIMHLSAEQDVKTKRITGWGRIRSSEKNITIVFRDRLRDLKSRA